MIALLVVHNSTSGSTEGRTELVIRSICHEYAVKHFDRITATCCSPL